MQLKTFDTFIYELEMIENLNVKVEISYLDPNKKENVQIGEFDVHLL